MSNNGWSTYVRRTYDRYYSSRDQNMKTLSTCLIISRRWLCSTFSRKMSQKRSNQECGYLDWVVDKRWLLEHRSLPIPPPIIPPIPPPVGLFSLKYTAKVLSIHSPKYGSLSKHFLYFSFSILINPGERLEKDQLLWFSVWSVRRQTCSDVVRGGSQPSKLLVLMSSGNKRGVRGQ